MTEDINGPVIINADNITLDCQGHKIIGSSGNYNSGILLKNRTGVVVKNCKIESFFKGINLDHSFNNQLINNEIIENGMGISLWCSSDNSVTENNIANNNGDGINLSCAFLCSNNLVYHNNFKDNGQQASVFFPHNDLFDNGYPSGGNYWSDYNGDDLKKGEKQDQDRSDSIGDTAYPILSKEARFMIAIPFIKENGWKEEMPEWRRNILAGDILYDPFASGVGHVGLYVGDDWVVEAIGVPVGKSGYPGKVKENPITAWDYPQKDTVHLLRVKKPDGMQDDIWNQKKQEAIDFVYQQYTQNKPYDWHWNKKQYDIDSPSWYCSELVWAAYFNQGVDLEFNSLNIPILFPAGLPIITNFSPVSPAEIFRDEDTETISSHLEGSDEIPWYKEFAPLFVLSPVNVIITDKDGNILSQSENNIPGATFVENQTDADGHKYSIIYLPVEYGPYKIQVVRKPEPDAQDGNKYSLKTQTEDGDKWLVKNQSVLEGDEEHEYDFDPAALNDDGDDDNNSATGGFNDTEESSGNTCQAGTLDFSLESDNDFDPPVTSTQSSLRNITVAKVNQNNLDFQYKVKAENFSGDLCDALSITNNITNETQNLTDFVSATVANSGPQDDWTFTIALTGDDSNLQDPTCNFDLVFEGWQENMNYGKGGFADEEIISGTIKSEGEIPAKGDVIINEVMWMGSYDSDGKKDGNDEWIELYNRTGEDIDLSNWRVEGAGTGIGDKSHLEIPHGYKIKAGGYFLIINNKWDDTAIKLNKDLDSDEGMTHISGMNFNNNGELLVLKSEDKNIIDTAWKDGSHWPAGCNDKTSCLGKRQSMERNDDPDSGWHTCDPLTMSATELSLMKSYWDGDPNIISDEEWKNYGTPGAANLSKNDPSGSSSSKNIQELEITEPPVQELLPPESLVVKPKEEDIGDEEIEIKIAEEIITEEIEIEIKGELNLADGLKIKKDSFKRKIEKIELKGVISELEKIGDKIIINMDKLDKIKEAGEFKFKIENLDLPESLKVVDYTVGKAVFIIEIEKEDSETQEKYDELILEADEYFENEDYEKAKSSYKNALEIKPGEKYPENQLDKIEEILKELVKEQDALADEDEEVGEENLNSSASLSSDRTQVKPNDSEIESEGV